MLLMIAGDSALLPWPMKDYTGVPSEQQVSSARLSQVRVPGGARLRPVQGEGAPPAKAIESIVQNSSAAGVRQRHPT